MDELDYHINVESGQRLNSQKIKLIVILINVIAHQNNAENEVVLLPIFVNASILELYERSK